MHSEQCFQTVVWGDNFSSRHDVHDGTAFIPWSALPASVTIRMHESRR